MPVPSLSARAPSREHLDAHPVYAHDNVHALFLGAVPLVAEGAVLLRVPEGADGAVHTTTASRAGF